MRPRLALLVLALVATIAVHPLAAHGPSCGHDFDFHLLNWLEAAQQFRHGNLHPQWAATPAWNAGEPRFVFYPPLSWTIGAVLTLLSALAAKLLHIAPASAFAATPIVYTWLVLFSAGTALFGVARCVAGQSAALLAAAIYETNAYTLFTAYERTAYAELLAAALFPLLLALMLPATFRQPPSRQPFLPALALVVALLWLANAPAAVMGCYTLALLVLFRVASLLRQPRDIRAAAAFALRSMAGVLLGLALAAFFLVPAIADRPWVQLNMAILPGLRPEDNTLFHNTGDPGHDAVLHAASLIALLLLAATAIALTLIWPARKLRRRTSPLAISLAATAAVLALMLTPLADPLWRHIPELAYLQFPWRLLAVLSPVLAISIALALDRIQLRPRAAVLAALGVSFAATLPAYHAFRQSCFTEDTPQARFAQFTSFTPQDRGSEPTDEYTPATADNDPLADANPPYRLLSPTDSVDASPPAHAAGGPAPHTLDLHLASPMLAVLNLRDYPAWRVTRNGVVLHDRVARTDGLLTLHLPAGDSHLEIRYRTTPAERAGDLTSVLALAVLVLVWRRDRRPPSASAL